MTSRRDVLKAGAWHLVVTGNGPEQVICLDALRATRLTAQLFERPPDFSLDVFWSTYLATPAARSVAPALSPRQFGTSL